MYLNEFGHPVLKHCYSIIVAPISAHPAPYLIRFAPPAFTPHRRARSGGPPSPLVVFRGSKDFTPTRGVPSASPAS